MDWKQITEKITPYTTKVIPYIEKAKTYGLKAVEFAEDQIQMTSLFIRTQDEYTGFLTEKRFILIAYDETDTAAQDIRLLSPVWLTRAFMDTAQLRFISLVESVELARTLGLSSPLDMRVIYEGVETIQLQNIDEIKKWWQSPVYTKTVPNDQKLTDPLAGK